MKAMVDPIEIYDLRKRQLSQDQIARQVGVTQSTVGAVLKRIKKAHENNDTKSEWYVEGFDYKVLRPISQKGKVPKKGKYL